MTKVPQPGMTKVPQPAMTMQQRANLQTSAAANLKQATVRTSPAVQTSPPERIALPASTRLQTSLQKPRPAMQKPSLQMSPPRSKQTARPLICAQLTESSTIGFQDTEKLAQI